uniref:Glycoprotein n=1 Tax=Hymenopteran phenui-related virus OKIAV282 TaxID=2746253 RepID=A0A7D7F307_9VIRU|nr:glycoprotein [Hymenopteran phenui-related virus OKIAV282]
MLLKPLTLGLPPCNGSLHLTRVPSVPGGVALRQGSVLSIMKPGDLIGTEGTHFMMTADCVSIVRVQHSVPLSLILGLATVGLLGLGLLFLTRLRFLLKPLRVSGYPFVIGSLGVRMNTPNGLKTIPMRTLLLAFFWLAPLLDACVQTSLVSNTLSASLATSDSVCFRSGHITMTSLTASYPLAFMYETSSWKLDKSFSWGCGGGSCPYVENCETMDLKMSSTLHPHDGMIEKYHCRSYPKSCAFSRGCWWGSTKITWSGTRTRVFGLLPGTLKHTMVSTAISCNTSVNETPMAAPPSGYLVLSHKPYFCPTVSAIGKPTKGLIGDLQIRQSATFDWAAIRCSEGWFSSHECSVTHPPALDSECVELPGIYDGKMVHFREGRIEIILSDPVRVSFACNDTISQERSSCHSISIEIEGYRESGVGISIVGRASSSVVGDSVILPLNCSSDIQINLPCDGELHYFTMSEPVTCTGIKDHSARLGMAEVVTRTIGNSFPALLTNNETGILQGLGVTGCLLLALIVVLVLRK